MDQKKIFVHKCFLIVSKIKNSSGKCKCDYIIILLHHILDNISIYSEEDKDDPNINAIIKKTKQFMDFPINQTIYKKEWIDIIKLSKNINDKLRRIVDYDFCFTENISDLLGDIDNDQYRQQKIRKIIILLEYINDNVHKVFDNKPEYLINIAIFNIQKLDRFHKYQSISDISNNIITELNKILKFNNNVNH